MAKRRMRSDLGKYLRRGTVPIGIKGGKTVTIPIDSFEIPSFRYGFPEFGVGQGEGQPGDDLGPVDGCDCDDPDGPGPGSRGWWSGVD